MNAVTVIGHGFVNPDHSSPYSARYFHLLDIIIDFVFTIRAVVSYIV